MKQRAQIILATKGTIPPDLLKYIEQAGRTCYKSFNKITDDSAEKLIKALIKSGHESVIEHSWLIFLVKYATPGEILNLILASPLLAGNIFPHGDDGWLICGNARMFRDLFRSGTNNWIISGLFDHLREALPALFADLTMDLSKYNQKNSENIILSPKINLESNEQSKAYWAMVRFEGFSRAFTHQLVRHRLMAISQESQRYCDEKGIYQNNYFVVPNSFMQAGLAEKFRDRIKEIDNFYQELQVDLKAAQQAGKAEVKVNEDARYILPNACCSEIVISTNLQEWRHIFKMRCDSHAQWEIRLIMLDLLKEFQKIFPGIFDDFILASDGKSASLRQ